MKLPMLSCVLLAAFPGGERERGIELYRQGKYAEAQAQFAKALEREPDSAELQWNLALAAWRAGDLETAEIAADKYSASSQAAEGHLYRGLRGAVRYAEAERYEQQADAALAAPPQPMAGGDDAEPAEPLPLLEKALQQAMQARIEFTKGVRDKATPELIRNTERALRKVEELKKRIEELRQQQQQQQQPKQDGDQDEAEQKPEEAGDDSDDKQSPGDDEQQKQPQPKPEQGESEGEGAESNEPPKPDAPKPDEPKQREPKESSEPGESPEPPSPPSGEPEQAPEPQPEPQPEPTPNGDGQQGEPPDVPEPQPVEPDASKPAPEPSERRDAPGEQADGRELSPEETQRLMELLRELDEQLREARGRRRVRRKPVERDW